VADGDRAVCVEKQHSLGLANDVGASHNHAFLACDLHTASLQQGHHARRRAGEKVVIADHDLTHVHRVEGIHVLAGINAENDLVFVQMSGQRKLTQNAVYLGIGVEAVHKLIQLLLCGAFGKLVGLRIEADLVAGTAFVAHVHARGGVRANDDHGKTGLYARLCLKACALFLDFGTDLCRYCFSVNDSCHIFCLLFMIIPRWLGKRPRG